MKSLTSSLLICFLFSCNSANQKVGYKDLIGTWVAKDPTNQQSPMTWEFIDNAHLICYQDGKEFSRLTYRLDTLSNPTSMEYLGVRDEDSLRLDAILLLKKIDDNTIKWQAAFKNNKPSKEWDRDENAGNTATLRRKRE